jgi:hypothetical protein
MSSVATAAAGGAAGAAAIAQATRASGVIIGVEPEQFERILERMKEPLVVVCEGGFFQRSYRYMTSYKGLAFHTKTSLPLHFTRHTELVQARSMWVP